ncbi:ABC transporter substrate-binding protein [Pseudomonas capeferrum]|uniref:substrate-binding periplasmic protein n=1 Tax=Pseudomonas capeferrum TaxID=1495066 RepID=UPI0015E29ABD|nr:transporter substrate-binding domain-containing protein [Pseudomonas capeferrum]MBA1202786.1 ABC transporter substrate-binding protein [Pseudomonas capeferrum]
MRYRLTFCSSLLLILLALHSHAQGIDVVTEDSRYAYLRDGKVVGPATQVAQAMLDLAALGDYRIVIYPWARAYEKALREPDVLIYPLDRTSAREHSFKWVGEIATVTTRLYKLRDGEKIVLNSLAQAKSYSIGVVRYDTRQLLLQQRGFTRLVVSDNNRDNFQKLLNHQVRLLPLTERSARQSSEDAQVDFSILEEVYSIDEQPDHVYMAFSLSTPDDTVARARRAFEKLKASGELGRLMGEH